MKTKNKEPSSENELIGIATARIDNFLPNKYNIRHISEQGIRLHIPVFKRFVFMMGRQSSQIFTAKSGPFGSALLNSRAFAESRIHKAVGIAYKSNNWLYGIAASSFIHSINGSQETSENDRYSEFTKVVTGQSALNSSTGYYDTYSFIRYSKSTEEKRVVFELNTIIPTNIEKEQQDVLKKGLRTRFEYGKKITQKFRLTFVLDAYIPLEGYNYGSLKPKYAAGRSEISIALPLRGENLYTAMTVGYKRDLHGLNILMENSTLEEFYNAPYIGVSVVFTNN